ncbi:hypothetical protein [Pelagibaculum spongiae]|uniref:Uncharacterized protein n=1 Tax=Pelagibaculum spongiae TaxID=2080658 RepID=A0A2V1GSE2_9GAMM|nr:hypothetical protein [Pelagibaculum spongiae]PVZ68212.1 hypothetical protein DC094_13005 [Pelagibaculum spongiae]
MLNGYKNKIKIKNEIRDYYKEKLIQKAYKELSRADYKKFKSTISKSDDWSMTRNWDITQDVAKLDKIKKLGTAATYATLLSQGARAFSTNGDQRTDAFTTAGVAGAVEKLGDRLNAFKSVKTPTSAAGFAVNAALGALAYFTSDYAGSSGVDSEGKPNSLLDITGHAKYWVREQL